MRVNFARSIQGAIVDYMEVPDGATEDEILALIDNEDDYDVLDAEFETTGIEILKTEVA